MPDGFLALVLHAHLPYLRHPEGKEHLEERWFFEAVTECYLPLLKVLERLVADGVDFRLTISLSPPLLAMFADPLLMERYGNYLDALVELGEKEVRRTARLPEFRPLALFYLENFLEMKRAFYEDYGGNVISGFKSLAASGKVELITTTATHGYLPLMSSAEARRAQVAAGLQFFTASTGIRPPGFWLPECGYVPGLEELLGEQGLRYFFTEAHCVLHSRPRPRFGVYVPVYCGGGRRAVAAFARDPLSSRQVWDRQAGYPGDPAYREFYRDIGYDLGLDYLGSSLPGGIRVDTGLKYYRITGQGPLHEKEPYRPEEARARAAEHAADFVLRKKEQISRLKAEVPAPVVVAPYDAELFGHWWYEGPRWLDCLCRRAGDQRDFRMVTPSEYLAARPELQTVELSPGSWGEGGYHFVWLNESNDWLYRHLHRAEAKMSELADLAGEAGEVAHLEKRALNLAAKELLLAQSSDWAFILKAGTAAEYAKFRFVNHLQNFKALVDQVERREIDEGLVLRLERSGGVFPAPDYRLYSRHARMVLKKPFSGGGRRFKVMILSWEYPPVTVGGLSRHVHDLAHALAALGDDVHILTCPHRGQGTYFFDGGVHVHRVPPESVTAQDFFTWVEELNGSLYVLGRRVAAEAGPFDLVHGHDWLVERSAKELRESLRIPFLATIHATEYGRNQGIHTELQRRIHRREQELAGGADLVITCSNFMAEEVRSLFGIPREKIRVIPNGVDPGNLARTRGLDPDWRPERKKGGWPLILFFGRLVPEKGVQVLLEALPAVAGRVPGVRLKVAGRGPYEDSLRAFARRLQVEERVEFVGYVDDQGRNRLLREGWAAAFPSLYEPFGIVALEAMAAGVPVVVSDTGGLGDLVEHGVDGYKFPPGKSELLAYYLGELLVNRLLAEEFCQRAWRKVLALYDWRYIAAATREVYGELAG